MHSKMIPIWFVHFAFLGLDFTFVLQAPLTFQEAKEQIQASPAELEKGLRDRHILIVDSEEIIVLLFALNLWVRFFIVSFIDVLRPIAPGFLDRSLVLILDTLVSKSMKHTTASVEDLSSALYFDHEISRVVSTQIMSWFGEIKEGKWKMDVNGVVKEIGLGILRRHRVRLILLFLD